MNALEFVSRGVYGAATSAERANYFVSCGMMASLPIKATPLVCWVSIMSGSFSSIIGG